MIDSSFEKERVARHVKYGELRARERDVSQLPRVKKLIRRLLLDELAVYIDARRFPKNRDFPKAQVPVFVDHEGTRCAIAHLMEVGGAADLVRKIQAQANLALVPELAVFTEVAAWLEAAGITAEEAALIQPTYCKTQYSDCLCEGSWYTAIPQAVGVLEAARIDDAGASVRVIAIYGQSLGYQVGDLLEGVAAYTTASTVLIPLTAEDAKTDAGASDSGVAGSNRELRVVGIDETGRPTACSRGDAFEELPMSKQDAIEALQSPSCTSHMASIDRRWAERPACRGDEPAGDSLGCGVATDPASPSVAMLLAVVGAVAALRRRRALLQR